MADSRKPRRLVDRWVEDEAHYAEHPLQLDERPQWQVDRDKMDATLAAAGQPPLSPIES